jgi:3-hydroxybutyryl-CoA dehydrogenase
MKIAKVGIIGAGQMGCGIAQVCAMAGYDVGLHDMNPDRMTAAIASIDASLARKVKSGKITEDARKSALAHISPVPTYAGFSDHDLIIESATENEAIKRQIFEALCPQLKPECIIGTNTSSISITRLAAVTGRPERFMGIHFMNPVPVMERHG